MKLYCISIFASTSLLTRLTVEAFNVKKLFRFGSKSMPKLDAPPPTAEKTPRPYPDKDIMDIFSQNQAWKQKKLVEDEDFFNKLGSEHKPDYMWIGM